MKKILPYYTKAVVLVSLALMLVYPASLKAQEADSTTTPTTQTVRGFANSIKPGVRSTALGGASVADYTELSSIYTNPAVLSFVQNLKRIELNSSQDWDNNLMLQNFAVPFFAYKRHRAALQTGVLHNGLASTGTAVPGLESNPSFMLYRFDLAYAISITSAVSMGFLSSTSVAHNTRSTEITNVASFGVIYAPSRSISYGVAYRGLGRSVGYEIVKSGKTELITQNTTQSLEIGATLNYPVDSDRTYFSLSLANEKRFGDPGIWYKAGLELKLRIVPQLPSLQLRNGIIMEPESDIFAPTFGLGTDFNNYSVGLSISPGTQLNERFYQLGIIIHFD